MGYKKTIISGNFLEYFEYDKDLPVQPVVRKKRSDPRFFKPTSRRSSNLVRLRKLFIRLVWANLRRFDHPAFLTLTMLQIAPLDVSYSCFMEFIRRARRVFGQSFCYIAVPEFQKRGAVHFHVLIWGLNDVAKKEIYERTLQNLWGYGYVDCILTDGSPKIAGYLAKYMSKTMSDPRLLGQKSYVTSRNVLRSVSISSGTPFALREQIFGISGDKKPIKEKEFMTQWLGRGIYKLFAF